MNNKKITFTDLKNKVVLITGGTGFIGSHTCLTLLNQNYSIIVLDSNVNSSQIALQKIIEIGLLPNEIKWLESFVDFYKGCFMGQEQASRVNFRGKPRRILKFN